MKNFTNRWNALWHPERYHGWGRKKKYFEGWYYKLISKDESLAIALIPGISMDIDGNTHSFIQMIDGTAGKTYYQRFKHSEFVCQPDRFHVRVGHSEFDGENVTIDLPHIQGKISFEKLTTWPQELGAPGIMGWYSFVPLMQCYHGVVSLYHKLEGSLLYNDHEYDFSGGIGYIEKDWGTSFPKCWIWMQCNHFGDLNREVSFMSSVAHIPWLGRYFVGFLVGFWLDDTLYQFTSYNGSKMVSSMDEEHVYLHFYKNEITLNIKATKGATGELISPIIGEMVGKVNESLTATIDVQLIKNGVVIYESMGRNAGLEVAGDVRILLTEKE